MSRPASLSSLRPVLRLFREQAGSMLRIGALLAALTALFGLGLLALSGWFIAATAIAGLSLATAWAFDVFAPGGGIRLLTFLRAVSRYGERLTLHDATLGVLADLRGRVFRSHAAPAAAGALMKRPSGALFQIGADVEALEGLHARVIAPGVAALAAAALLGVMLAFLDWRLGLATAGLLAGVGFALTLRSARAAEPWGRRKAAAQAALRARIADLSRGRADLLMAGRLEAQEASILAAQDRLAAADGRLNRIERRMGLGLGLLTALMLAGVLLATAALAERGVIGAPGAALALLAVIGAVEPFGLLRRGAAELGRMAGAARRIGPRLAEPAPEPAAKTPPEGIALRLTQASARPPGATRATLKPLDLILRQGERVALIGASGAGKSTLLSLMAGELAPETGAVERLAAARLTQRADLFQETLREALRLGAPEASEAEMREALEAAGLGELLATLPDGLETRLGEGGLGLSGGQARRLALARLLLREAPLWLLDEPTEALDGPLGREILTRLSARLAGRTLVVATHLRREAEMADRLIVMSAGAPVADLRRGEAAFAAALPRLRGD
ncbi:amino acid ABC transporter ATP-binding/permease protein [Neomegalonema sp.]|uniref:amino acid ABC transporter ATP-binding/permease protein n=1 Tax=Neomegalonema sp. TaxID=2039713 RepID=UPI00262D3780|nr:ATP-binding cassette domain-containing protein [Neomegalonema sp.]MDD2869567.1 ATP-binding cassette domain-containing protein [Neomegalonema sp.]